MKWWNKKAQNTRDQGLGDAAAAHVMLACFKERVLSSSPITINNSQYFLISTECKGAPFFTNVGKQETKEGRVLISTTADVDKDSTLGGAYWIQDRSLAKVLQSLYVRPEYRGGMLTGEIAKQLKTMGITKAQGPASSAGQKFTAKHGFELEGNQTQEEIEALSLEKGKKR